MRARPTDAYRTKRGISVLTQMSDIDGVSSIETRSSFINIEERCGRMIYDYSFQTDSPISELG